MIVGSATKPKAGFLFYAAFRIALNAAAPAAFAGLVLGRLCCDTIHYVAHHGRWRAKLARLLRRRHLRHHYGDDRRDYGVSAPIWDAALGTLGQGRTEAPSRHSM